MNARARRLLRLHEHLPPGRWARILREEGRSQNRLIGPVRHSGGKDRHEDGSSDWCAPQCPHRRALSLPEAGPPRTRCRACAHHRVPVTAAHRTRRPSLHAKDFLGCRLCHRRATPALRAIRRNAWRDRRVAGARSGILQSCARRRFRLPSWTTPCRCLDWSDRRQSDCTHESIEEELLRTVWRARRHRTVSATRSVDRDDRPIVPRSRAHGPSCRPEERLGSLDQAVLATSDSDSSAHSRSRTTTSTTSWPRGTIGIPLHVSVSTSR